jgi:DNA repair exonuclease SbcCD nuclease subunit
LGDGGYSWLEAQLNCLEQIFEYANHNNVGIVIFNGDLFEEKNKINAQVYNRVWENFYTINRPNTMFIQFIFNTGNHDFLNYKRLSLLKPFSSEVDLIEEPWYDASLYFVPYGMLTDEIVENKEGHELLFTHEEIYGLDAGYEIKSRYKVSDFSNWGYVFNGHIHKPQQIGNVWNVGSMMQQDFGEEGQLKRFLHYKDGEVISIPIQHPCFITFEDVNVLTSDITTYSAISMDEYNHYRINIDSSQLSHEIFKKWNVKPNIIKTTKKEVRLQSNLTIEDEIEKYVEISDTSLSKEKLKTTAREFIGGE